MKDMSTNFNGTTIRVLSVFSLYAGLLFSTTESHAASPTFASTSDPSYWQVAINQSGVDGSLSSFPTSGFSPAVAVVGRTTDGVNWIANNSTGTNSCCIGNWKFFVFRQTVDLTGYNPSTADLKFQWAADDSGEGFATRGSWKPKYRLNGGSLVDDSWPSSSTYSFGNVTEISTGFVSGLNTFEFYVEGNGVTDGFALKTVAFTTSVPEPSSWVLLLAGLGLLGLVGPPVMRREGSTVGLR
jgi:hypothetical protein